MLIRSIVCCSSQGLARLGGCGFSLTVDSGLVGSGSGIDSYDHTPPTKPRSRLNHPTPRPDTYSPTLTFTFQMTSDPLQTLSPSHAFGSAAHSAATHHHSIPFGHQPGAQPGQLSYGFGLSPASNLSTQSIPAPSWGTLPSWAQARSGSAGFGSPGPSTQFSTGFGIAGPSQPPSWPSCAFGTNTNTRRRRRSSSGDSDDSLAVRDSLSLNSSPSRPIKNFKKLRAVSTPAVPQSAASLDSVALHGLAVGGREGQDVGKALGEYSA